ncbi:sugar phosphate nucleotidyltransferase [Rickettsia africae]|uniref:sugar phosphate nucleotidyltransferase n=1 Tax=Rickettsia africae TaxID=35788 RepID=UPI0002E50A91|nr:sugar phosphate nucleotidyltransferase [Rickettsia africae]
MRHLHYIPINVISAKYGYINTGLPIAENVYLVDHLIEQPILEQANKHFQSNEYFWNSGICVYDVNFFLNLTMNLQPDLFCIAEKAFNTAVKNENSLAIDNEAYNEIAAISLRQYHNGIYFGNGHDKSRFCLERSWYLAFLITGKTPEYKL